MFDQLVETKRLQNFERVAAGGGDHEGLRFNDSDVYKWLEASAYALAVCPHPELEAQVHRAIAAVAAAQQPDGYINTFVDLMFPEAKWKNLNALHEMYCAGHLIEAAVALSRDAGIKTLMPVAVKFADLIVSTFGPHARQSYCGHQEIELALIRLADETGGTKYRDTANWMIEARGHQPSPFAAEIADPSTKSLSPLAAELLLKNGEYSGEYAQDHSPIREHKEVVGHAVRAMYYYTAATQLAQDSELQETLYRVYKNLVGKRMYITGGLGPSGDNEGFTSDFDLPNLTAYAETCAAVGLVFWTRSMLERTGDSDFADIMELALYNGALSGISLDGQHYFYENPLESRGDHRRVTFFGCACCPPNIARLIGSLGQYVASVSDDGFYIHIPAGFDASFELNGTLVKVKSTSNYPWSGKVIFEVEVAQPVEFALHIRIPGWAEDVALDLKGSEEGAEYADGYAVYSRTWTGTSTIEAEFEIEPIWMEADPRVKDNLGRTALKRGPLVYCCEEVDLGFAPQLFTVDCDADVMETEVKKLPGIKTLEVAGTYEINLFPDELYAPVGATDHSDGTATMIPYYAWCNRGKNNMQVWLRRS